MTEYDPPGGLSKAALDTAFASGVSVRSHGAKGDGITDDSAAIRATIANAAPLGLGVSFPQGTYLVSQDGANSWCLDLPAGTRITGVGTIRKANSQSGTVRVLRVAASDVVVQGVTIDGNKTNQTANQQNHGIAVLAGGFTARGLRIKGCGGDGILLDGSATTAQHSITGCRIDTCDRNGVTLYGSGAGAVLSDVLIANNDIEAAVQPIDSEPVSGAVCNRVRIHGNRLKSTGNDYALTLMGSSAAAPNADWTVSGNVMTGALYVQWQKSATIVGNLIDATGGTNSAVHAYAYSENIRLIANTITASGQTGIDLAYSLSEQATGWNIQGNLIRVSGSTAVAVSLHGPTTVTCHGNYVTGANNTTGIEVRADAGMKSVIVTGNTVDGFVTGIYAAPNGSNNVNRLVIAQNSIDNTQATPTMTYGIRLAGAVSQFLDVVVTENVVNPSYSTPVDLSSAVVRFGGTKLVGQFSGTGSPNSVLTANVGSTYLDRNGGAGTTFYVKESGTKSNTGWVAK